MKRNNLWATMGVAVVAAVMGSLVTLAVTGSAVLPRAEASEGRQDDVVKAHQFVLLDRKGEVKGVWSTGKQDDMPVIAMVGKDGKVRMSLAITKDGSPAIGLTDADEKSRIGLAVTEDSDAAFTLMNAKGDVVAALGVESDKGISLLNGVKKD